MPTTHLGALCMQRCSADTDCRAGEGYVCDARHHACVMPNVAVITPKTCPAPTATRGNAAGRNTRLSAALPGGHRAPSAVLGPTGDLVAMFVTDRGVLARSTLTAAKKTAPSSTITDQVIGTSSDQRGEPSLARDTKGILYATWLDASAEDRTTRILLARSRDGGATWSGPDRADDPDDCAARTCLGAPIVVVGPDRHARGRDIVYILYAARDGIRVRASRDEGATFRAAATALPGTVANAHVAADGSLHVIAIDSATAPTTLVPPGPATSGPAIMGAFGSGNHRIVYAVSADMGRTFSPPQRLDRRDELLPAYFARPQIVVDSRRRQVYALYVRGGHDGVWDLMLMASKDAGKTWRRTRIGDDCAVHAVPQLALDATTGTVHIAWFDNRGGGRFARASCSVGASKCQQLGAISEAPFALSFERFTPAWIGEHAALVVDDKRRMLHAVWAQPVVEGAGVATRIMHAVATLR